MYDNNNNNKNQHACKQAKRINQKKNKPKKVKEKAIKLTLKSLKRDTKSEGRVG